MSWILSSWYLWFSVFWVLVFLISMVVSCCRYQKRKRERARVRQCPNGGFIHQRGRRRSSCSSDSSYSYRGRNRAQHIKAVGPPPYQQYPGHAMPAAPPYSAAPYGGPIPPPQQYPQQYASQYESQFPSQYGGPAPPPPPYTAAMSGDPAYPPTSYQPTDPVYPPMGREHSHPHNVNVGPPANPPYPRY